MDSAVLTCKHCIVGGNGSEFQNEGPADEKARRPKCFRFRLFLGTTTRAWSDLKNLAVAGGMLQIVLLYRIITLGYSVLLYIVIYFIYNIGERQILKMCVILGV